MKQEEDRLLLKLSGESLGGKSRSGIDFKAVEQLGEQIARAKQESGVDLCIVTGGGNLLRGAAAASGGVERAQADYMGMLGTVINALALQGAIEQAGQPARVLSAIPMRAVCEPYIRRRALRHMEKGRIVLCAAGTGNPYVTTDTAAALRAAELKCSLLLKATHVDGVYSADPKKDKKAKRYDRLTYEEVLASHLEIMDASAISLCRENNIPVSIFALHDAKDGFTRAFKGRGKGSLIAAADMKKGATNG